MSDEIENRVLGILRTKLGKGGEASNVQNNELLVRAFVDFGFDSLEKLEFIMDIEDSFHITLNEESVSRCKNVRNLVELISSTVEGGIIDN